MGKDFLYEGETLESLPDLPHGRGRMIGQNKDGSNISIYDGWFSAGKMEGYGRIIDYW